MSKFNYRKFYKEQTKKDIPKNYDVHHIDGIRSNNVIENLVAIPRDIHRMYHLNENVNKRTFHASVLVNPMSYNFDLDMFKRFAAACEIIHYHIWIRDSLLQGNTRSTLGHDYNTDFSRILNSIK